ncbi:MAG: sulfotransferase family protein [Myxococcota bacterium]
MEDAPSDWRPGPRPAWVQSLHTIADPAWIRLEADELLDEAMARSGLSDFGDGAFQEPYRIFVRALNEEAQLHALGRLIARSDLLNWLENRLALSDWRKRHPGIAAEAIERPIFITGLPRSGTSILHELLAQDPAHRAPLHWEVRHPCPPPDAAARESDPRIERAERQVQLWNQIVPEYRAMHELGARLPVECIQITAHEFRSEELMGRHQVPSYAAWYASADLVPAYRFHRLMLQHLGWRDRPERWVLKAPSHLAALRPLLAVYPDACIVVTHRDPLRILPSVASILYSTAYVRSDAVDPQALLGWFTGETCLGLLDGMSQLRTSAAVDPAQFHDVRYSELVARPFETIAALYVHFGLHFSREAEERMRAYLAAKPQGKHGAHRYDFAATGLEQGAERERFRAYQERYGVRSET